MITVRAYWCNDGTAELGMDCDHEDCNWLWSPGHPVMYMGDNANESAPLTDLIAAAAEHEASNEAKVGK